MCAFWKGIAGEVFQLPGSGAVVYLLVQNLYKEDFFLKPLEPSG